MSKRSARRNKYREQRNEREGERRLDTMEVKALDTVAEIVERKVGADESRQPRFTDAGSIFSSVVRWASWCSTHEPGSRATMREWDTWYRDFVANEPFLAGCLASAVQIDKNRGWTLTGGRNQVARYTKSLHSFSADVTGSGWRPFMEWVAQSYYVTQMGWIGEVGSAGKNGPLLTMWAVDPCRCALTGNSEKPLMYYPRLGGQQEWSYGVDFLRGVSQKQTSEDKLGYGFPAVARCYTLAKIMYGVYRHYQMKTGITTPDGVLAHNAMSDEQWQKALEVREQELRHDPDGYLNSLVAVGNPGGEVPQFVLTMLSSLPDRWDIEQWTLILMRGYQLAFGYGAGEFYPEQYSVVGRGKEQEMQHRTSTGKGGKDFALTFAEQLQSRLPPTLEFGFEERDVSGELEDAQLQQAKAAVITEISKWVIESGGTKQSVMTPDQLMQLAAQQGVIPEEWTPQEEEAQSTDEDAPGSERIHRAMLTFPDEPIVRYAWPSGKTRILRTARRRSFYIPKVVTRQGEVASVAASYREQLQAITDDAMGGGNEQEIANRHRELIVATAILAYVAGMKAGGVSGDEMTGTEKAAVAAWTAEQLSHVDQYAADAVAAGNDPTERDKIASRLELWVAALIALGGMGLMSAQADTMGTWRLGATEEHCRTCAGLHGKRHRLSWYKSRGLIPREPGSVTLECKGYQCDCHIEDDRGNVLL